MKSPIPAIYKSSIRAVTDFIEDVNAAGILDHDAKYHDFESRNDENDLPRCTIIGTEGFSFDENDGRWMIRYAIAVSSFNDANLHREIELIGMLHERFGKDKKIRLIDPENAEEVNELVVAKFDLAPMGQSELRNYRVASLELHRTGAEY